MKMTTKSRFDIVALGELLIDFSEYSKSAEGNRLYEQNPGGAPANVLSMAAKFGLNTGFIGKVGNDFHGKFLKNVLQENNIDTSNLVLDNEFSTTLAFVSLSNDGEREFTFYRNPGADTQIRITEIEQKMLENASVFHIGSLSLTNEPARTTTIETIKLAKEHNAIISFDPNYRASLWDSQDIAVIRIKELLPMADYLKVSEEEAVMITNKENLFEAINELMKHGAICTVITRGSRGAMLAFKGDIIEVPAFKCEATDTTGAGDAFWGTFLAQLMKQNPTNLDDYKKCVKYANAAASLCVRHRGAIPAMPSIDEVNALLQGIL